MNAIKRTFGFIHNHPLAKRHLFQSYFRFINWQLKCSFNPNLQKVLFLEDTYFLAKRGLTGLTGNIYTGLHEFNDMSFLLHLLRPDDTFFDVGANVGSYTLLASSICKAKTIAFEPATETYALLKENIILNNIESLVTLENKAVGKENGYINFSINQDTTNHVVLNNFETEINVSVPMTSLDSYFPKQTPLLIKIDVEGFETEVLNGAKKILENLSLKVIIIELIGGGNTYGYKENKIHEKLIALSFRPYNYDPFNRTLTEIKTYGQSNTIYVRDYDFVLKKLKEARSFLIFNEEI